MAVVIVYSSDNIGSLLNMIEKSGSETVATNNLIVTANTIG